MTILLLNLRNVPVDEADEVRALLTGHQIEFYETQPSFWGFTAGGIWLHDAEQARHARQLMRDYQAERATRMREEYHQRLREGNVDTLMQRLWRRPILGLAILVAVALLCLLMLMPFILIGREGL